MSKEEVKKGQLIAESIRKVLLNVDLRIIYAESERKLALEDFRLNSKLGGKGKMRKALHAKARSECFKIYAENVKKVKGEITLSLDCVLSRYTPKYKRIWQMYFLEQASIDEIAVAVAYSRESINKIVQKLKLDLNYHYNGAINNDRK